MKKLLVLGASYTQTPLYELSRKIGIKTVAMSIPGPYPGFELADETDMHNIADPDAVLRAARDHHVDGIVTCGLDLGMRAIGAAAEALGLPGPSKEAAAKAANKLLMKEALVAAGVQTAPFCCVHSEDELEASTGATRRRRRGETTRRRCPRRIRTTASSRNSLRARFSASSP